MLATIASTPLPRFQGVSNGLRVYYATDDFVAGAGLLGYSREELQNAENRQIRDADKLVAISERISDRWGVKDKPVLILPNGCDPALGLKVARAQPDKGVHLPAPVVGVVGQLGPRLDLGILEAIAESGLSLLLVGPVDDTYESERVARLFARPNVQWVGRQPPGRLPDFYSCMSVGATPYRTTDFNLSSVPLKTLEYVAAGLPVVSTPIPATTSVPSAWIRTASEGPDFVAALRRFLDHQPTSSEATARDAFIATNSWSARAQALVEFISQAN